MAGSADAVGRSGGGSFRRKDRESIPGDEEFNKFILIYDEALVKLDYINLRDQVFPLDLYKYIDNHFKFTHFYVNLISWYVLQRDVDALYQLFLCSLSTLITVEMYLGR
jgi:hypothetical protein